MNFSNKLKLCAQKPARTQSPKPLALMLKQNLQMKKTFAFILFSVLLSCGSEYKMKSESFDWQPYKIGDKLIFESNTNQIDTIFVREIKSYTNPDDHLAIFPDYYTTYFITGEITLINPLTSSIGNKVK